jgi:hypothetical protein
MVAVDNRIVEGHLEMQASVDTAEATIRAYERHLYLGQDGDADVFRDTPLVVDTHDHAFASDRKQLHQDLGTICCTHTRSWAFAF